MKSQVVIAAGLVAVALVSCGPSEAEIKAAKEKATADSLAAAAAAEKSYTVDVANSSASWAAKVTGPAPYGHHGKIDFNSGSFSVKGGQLASGTFEVNMKSITPLDSAYQPEGSKQGTKTQLIGHLTTADFFAVDSFPTATFVVTSVEGNTATGELTVRGKKNTEKVTDIVITEDGANVKATGKLVFDRQKYGVAWKHFLKDAILSNDIELNLRIAGTAK
ncbi:MAG TPA: YceI family protein [Flavobacteriales bacterium]